MVGGEGEDERGRVAVAIVWWGWPARRYGYEDFEDEGPGFNFIGGGEGFAEVGVRGVVVAQGELDPAQAMQCGGYAAAVTGIVAKRQSFLEEASGQLVVVLHEGKMAQLKEGEAGLLACAHGMER